MNYKETFSYQWDNLVNKFKADMDKLPLSAIDGKKVKEWYETYSFVWESIVETEGIILSEQKNKELSVNLINTIKNFSFGIVTPMKRPKIIAPMAIAVLSGGILGFVMRHFALSWAWIVFEAIVCLLSGTVYYAVKSDEYEKKGKAALIDGYASYLKEYKGKLIGICEKYADKK